jgi:hypothetical protein
MNVNFYSAAVLTKEFARKRNHHENSSIVFAASVAGMLGTPAWSAYSASRSSDSLCPVGGDRTGQARHPGKLCGPLVFPDRGRP